MFYDVYHVTMLGSRVGVSRLGLGYRVGKVRINVPPMHCSYEGYVQSSVPCDWYHVTV